MFPNSTVTDSDVVDDDESVKHLVDVVDFFSERTRRTEDDDDDDDVLQRDCNKAEPSSREDVDVNVRNFLSLF